MLPWESSRKGGPLSNGTTDLSAKNKKRRSLNRRRTADFIWQMDALTIVVVVFTAHAKARSWNELGSFPWSIMMVGVSVLFVRMSLLMILSGSGYQMVSNIANFVGQSMTDKPDFRFQWSAGARPLAERKGGPLSKPTFLWFFLIALGMAALVAIAGSSGGFSSPFWEILLATFIIGQFRAPTGKGIWSLCWFGLLAAVAAPAVYQLLYNANPKSFAVMHFDIYYYIASIVLVLFVSTLVSYVTFITEPNLPESTINEVNNRPVSLLAAGDGPEGPLATGDGSQGPSPAGDGPGDPPDLAGNESSFPGERARPTAVRARTATE